MKQRLATAAIAIAALIVPQAAQAAECITTAEMSGMIEFLVPEILDQVNETCLPELASDSYLGREGTALVARYQSGQDAAWTRARAAFVKLSADGDSRVSSDLIDNLSDDELKPMVASLMGAAVAEDIKSESCPMINTMFEAFAPLPPANFAMALTSLLALAADDDDSFDLCPAS